MMTFEQYRDSLSDAAPPGGLGAALQALWWAGKGDWDRAHSFAQEGEGEPGCDWVHAYLHRVEGDLSNAAYWYRRAKQPVATGTLEEERDAVTAALLGAG